MDTDKNLEIRDLRDEISRLKWSNRIMRDALIQITGIRFWELSADYSPKKIAMDALQRTE